MATHVGSGMAPVGQFWFSRVLGGSRLAFYLIHVGGLAALFVPVRTELVVWAIVSYYVRMFGVTAGYHRYFSHRSYKLGRVSQLLFAINSLSHTWGTRRFKTADQSRNNFLLALLTLGEGWHNNHHYYMSSCRQSIRWWEVDVTYYVLRLLHSTALATKFLEAQALSAAHSWTRAVKSGAKRGRHEPARDLLLHTGAIQPVQNETFGQAKLAVFIGVSVQEQDTLLVDAQPVDEPIVEAQPIVGNGTATS